MSQTDPKCECGHRESRHSPGYKNRQCWAIEDECECRAFTPKKQASVESQSAKTPPGGMW